MEYITAYMILLILFPSFFSFQERGGIYHLWCSKLFPCFKGTGNLTFIKGNIDPLPWNATPWQKIDSYPWENTPWAQNTKNTQ